MSVGAREECVKCGYLETPLVEYQRKSAEFSIPSRGIFFPATPERLKVTCKRCQYIRYEACSDTFSAAGGTTK